MRFRPCIDLHNGHVKQIVGSTLQDDDSQDLRVNFSSSHPPSYYAKLYRQDNLTGGHVIMLGPGNTESAQNALAAWPGGLQIGGGINRENAGWWLEQGASHVIVTSHVFCDGHIHEKRLEKLRAETGKDRLVLDLSCRVRDDRDEYYVVTDRWQKFTDVQIEPDTLAWLADYCDEFLVHAVDVEGKCMGVDRKLIEKLASWSTIPTTYAGGVSTMTDMELILDAGHGRLDATVGSALDIFGGNTLTYKEIVAFHNTQQLLKKR